MDFFVIVQKSTGLLLPSGGKGMGGHTAQEPCCDRPPRLFMKRRTALSAMRAYIRGRWNDAYATNYGEEPDYMGPEPQNGTARNAEDFAVTEISMKVKQWK